MMDVIRKQIRQRIPLEVRKRAYVFRCHLEDVFCGIQFASLDHFDQSFGFSLVQEQVITPSNNYAQKVHNLALAIEQIHTVIVKPEQVFSFNRIVGEASPKRGYQRSRSLHNGVLVQTYGGGLCQLAGLIYQVSLQLGLEILERHNHSVDIYTDETRYTPLGSDATIVYPFKDMRIRNNSPFFLRFRFHIMEHKISITVEGTGPMSLHDITHQVIQTEPKKIVHTKNSHNEIVAISIYDELYR